MAVIWGIPYLLIRIAVEEVAPSVVVLGRTAIGAIILLPLVALRGDLRTVLRHWRWVAAFAVIEMAIPWVLVASAEQRLPSSTTALLIAGVPLVGALMAMARPGGETLGRTAVVGLLVGLAGVLAIVGIDSGPTDLYAVAELAIVVVCYAAGPVILVRRLGGITGMGVSAIALAMCAVAYTPFALAEWPVATPSPEAIASIVLLGVVCTAIAFVVFAALITEVGPVRATVITYVNPVVAAILGVLILGETLTLGFAIGFVLVLVGSALATRPARPSSVEAEPPMMRAESLP